MKKLKRFWRTFEDPGGIRGVRAHWRLHVGPELGAIAPFLRSLIEPSPTYPCPRRAGSGCPRHVVVHGPDDIVAVCRSDPKECDTIKLKPADIVEYEFDWKRFCGFLSKAFGLVPVAERMRGQRHVWHVGTWAVNPADHRPVFLVASASRSEFDGTVGVLLISHQAPFIVLALNPQFSGAAAAEGLRQRGAALLALEDIVLVSDEGKFVPAGTLPEMLGTAASPGSAPVGVNGYAFRREQDVWAIAFQGKTVHLKHLAGLTYIAELLRRPGTEIEAVALTGQSGVEAPIVAATNTGLPLADETTLAQVRAELEQRKAELTGLAPNDWARKGDLADEVEKLENYLRDVEGLHGRVRKTISASQRARLSAKNAVDRAISRIEPDHPALAQHLRESISTGVTLSYRPVQAPEWAL